MRRVARIMPLAMGRALFASSLHAACVERRLWHERRPARVDLAVPDEFDQVWQEAADRSGASVSVDAGEEEVDAGDDQAPEENRMKGFTTGKR